jgi:6-phosphogluconolactonase (cycloisomerase 2 family)
VAASSTTFTLAPAVAKGASYHVTVTGQPTSVPAETCSVTSGGTGVANANVTSIVVTCAVSSFTVGGTISGYTGSGLVLSDSVSTHTATPVSGAGSFTLSGTSNSGSTYNVTVTTQPTAPAQFCRVTGGAGNVTTAPITSIGVACTNVGKYVFVANTFDTAPETGSIGVFAINVSTGAIAAANGNPGTPATPVAGTDANPIALGVDPTGLYLYVANSGVDNVVPGTMGPPVTPTTISGGNDIATFTIGAGGTLTEGTPLALTNNLEPTSLAIDPTGPYLYVGNNDFNGDGAIVGLDPTAGVLGAQQTNSPYEGGQPLGLAVDSTNKFLFTANPFDSTVVVYPINGDGTLPATPGADPAATLTDPYAVATSPTGLYVYITDTKALPATVAGTVTAYSYSGTTGALTLVGSYPVGIGPEGIAIDPTGSFLYVSNTNDGTVSAFKISSTDGSLTVIGTYTSTTSSLPSASPTAVAIDPSGQFLYVANGDAGSITAFTITAGTGVLVAGAETPATNGPFGTGTSAIAIE